MRFLLDENLSPLLVCPLASAGHDVVHVRDLGLISAADPEVLDAAASDRRVLISADTDFGGILAQRHSSGCQAHGHDQSNGRRPQGRWRLVAPVPITTSSVEQMRSPSRNAPRLRMCCQDSRPALEGAQRW